MIELTRSQLDAIAHAVSTQNAQLRAVLATIGVKLVDQAAPAAPGPAPTPPGAPAAAEGPASPTAAAPTATSAVPEGISVFSATFLGPEAVAEVEARERAAHPVEPSPFVIGGSQK